MRLTTADINLACVVQLRIQILKATTSTAEEAYMHQSLSCINSHAVACLKASKHLEAIVAFDKLFKRLAKKHLTHADLYICYNNRAAAFLHVHLYDEALQDAEQARKLAEAALKRSCTHNPLAAVHATQIAAARHVQL